MTFEFDHLFICTDMGASAADRFPAHRVQPIEHQVDLREITRVEIVTPSPSDRSTALQAAIDTNCLNIRSGGEYGVELGFDGETQGQKVDFQPDLPLTISW